MVKDQITEKLKTAMKENNTKERRVIRTTLHP